MLINKEIRQASYIIKISDQCNLGCPYCYYYKDRNRLNNKIIDLNILSAFLKNASEINKQIEIIWHGGEPLAAGLDMFKHITEIQKNIFNTSGAVFRNLIQTNATLMSQEWADFFAQENFAVGISLDGPKLIHDQNRPNLGGKGTFEQTLRGLRTLQNTKIPVSVLAVVTKKSLLQAQDIYNFFVSNLNLTRFDFLPMAEVIEFDTVGDGQKSISFMPGSLEKNDFFNFIKEVFDIWWVDPTPNISIRYLDNVLLGLLGYRPTACTFNGSCGEYTTLDVDGNLLPCDNFIGYSDLVFGNISKEGLSNLLKSNKRNGYIRQVSHLNSICRQCKYLKACGGGCRKYNYFLNHNFDDQNYFCGDRWNIFDYVEQKIAHEQSNINKLITNFFDNNGLASQEEFPGSKVLRRLLSSHHHHEMQNSGLNNTWQDWDRGGGWDKSWDKGGWDKGW